MKKTIGIILAGLILFSGCQKTENLFKEEFKQPEVSNSTFNVESANTKITLPEGYSYIENQETGRRGSFASYEFVRNNDGPNLQEVFFFNEKSIDDYNKTCGGPSNLCFEGDYPSVQQYQEMKKAYESVSDYKNYHLFVFNDRNFLVTNMPCTGDSCVIRQYTTFNGDVRIDFWINMQDDTFQEEADNIFNEIKVE